MSKESIVLIIVSGLIAGFVVDFILKKHIIRLADKINTYFAKLKTKANKS